MVNTEVNNKFLKYHNAFDSFKGGAVGFVMSFIWVNFILVNFPYNIFPVPGDKMQTVYYVSGLIILVIVPILLAIMYCIKKREFLSIGILIAPIATYAFYVYIQYGLRTMHWGF